jgi:polyhydroxybutyrate depolymerase
MGRVSIVALVAILAAACASGTNTTSPTTPAPPTPSPSPTTAACDDSSDLPLGDDLYYREAGLSGRQYQLFIPSSYRPDHRVALVLDFHPWRGNAAFEEGLNRFEEVAEEAGFVLARPQAAAPSAAGPSWSVTGDDDVTYTEAVINDVRAIVCVDPARIYAAGMSQGGHLATWIACRLPGTFVAVASVAVLDHPLDCDPPPTPIIAFAGRRDIIYDIQDGLDASTFESASAGAPPEVRPGPLSTEAEAWAATNG